MQDLSVDGALYRLGLKHQSLVSRYIDAGMSGIAKQLKEMDDVIPFLIKSQRRAFDFVGHVMHGKILLVGEGNLSFAFSLSQKQRINPKNVYATTFESEAGLSGEAQRNAEKLKQSGANLLHGIDATHLDRYFGNQLFDHIIFQFPHSGSRDPIEGQNPNAVLVKHFLKSASRQLTSRGTVLISSVDSPHYHGALQCDFAARESVFGEPELYRFTPHAFPYYNHTTAQGENGTLEHHDAFVTWVFTRK